ncbi:MAG: hypothetical protein JNM94_13920 [Phycisphaerae bacterium]|nr:hypothetical protein [Phycisphaerae bacterium]
MIAVVAATMMSLAVLASEPGAVAAQFAASLAGIALTIACCSWIWLHLRLASSLDRPSGSRLAHIVRFSLIASAAILLLTAGVTRWPLAIRVALSERALDAVRTNPYATRQFPATLGLFRVLEVHVVDDHITFFVTATDAWGESRGIAFLRDARSSEALGAGSMSLAPLFGPWYEWIEYH